MAEILTSKFKSDMSRQFFDDIIANNYYIFVAGVERLDAENSAFSTNEFLEKVNFGKKFYNDDIHFMIKYYPWQRGNVYEQYDDRENLEDTNFYAVVGPTNNDTGDYRVYLCLFNNNNAEVQAPPAWNENTADQVYETADGYIWKFMYALTEIEFDAYNSIGYIPIIGDYVVNPVANTAGGEISDIVVENGADNLGYTKIEGKITEAPFANGKLIGKADQTELVSEVFQYYFGQTLYVVNPNGVAYLYTITNYTFDTGNGEIEFIVDGNPQGDGVVNNADWTILPRIQIDGNGLGASAIPEINDLGRISAVTILNRGSGYKSAIARVVDPLFDFDPTDPAKTDERAVLRVVLSPIDGHGHNMIDEFKCHHVGLYGYITAEDNLEIGANNTYSTIGVIRNPEFEDANGNPILGANTPAIFDNRIAVVTNDIGALEVNDVVTQINSDQEITFSALVHEMDYDANTIYLAEYMGPYVVQGNTSVSFDETLDLRNSTGQIIRINNPVNNNYTLPLYIQRTGEVYFFEDFFPLPRTENSREEFKFVMEF